ncbi:hypothetical protein O53_4959 [Microcystis aeruginosa TAIHU98]|uniref:Uncharacterized protein n=1 Tax=Microcystis aeruginosa TAIHU98 TaxID=1134457 RepID=L7DZ52_MICAE|nr:hypothetical protein O53_4959 [Microcystis aeruginosa TAIHU98]
MQILVSSAAQDYLGFAAKSFSWGQGVGCGVWGVGFYRF